MSNIGVTLKSGLGVFKVIDYYEHLEGCDKENYNSPVYNGNGGNNGAGYFIIEIWTDKMKFTGSKI